MGQYNNKRKRLSGTGRCRADIPDHAESWRAICRSSQVCGNSMIYMVSTDHSPLQQRPRIFHHPNLTTTIPLPLNDASSSTSQSKLPILDEVLPRNAQDYHIQVPGQCHLHSTDVGSKNDMGRSCMCMNGSLRDASTDPVSSSSSHFKDQAQSSFSHEAHESGMF